MLCSGDKAPGSTGYLIGSCCALVLELNNSAREQQVVEAGVLPDGVQQQGGEARVTCEVLG